MIRKAFRMSVHRGQEAEYVRRHNPICDELRRELLAHGVVTYSIFLDPLSNDLFAYVEVESEQRWQAIGLTPACRRWWESMQVLMPSNPDATPVALDLHEVFHLDLETDARATSPLPDAPHRAADRSGRR